MKYRMFFAGSGGQGILALGQMIAKAAMHEDKETTWLPSYGPEMRGGTANCTCIVSDRPIACPLLNEADLLVAMNLPSLLRFESMVAPGGLLIVNSSMVPQKPSRTDIRVLEIPANEIAAQLGSDKTANILVLSAILKQTGIVRPETVREEMKHMFTGRKEKFLAMNLKALDYYLD